MTKPILEHVKESLGIEPDNLGFDSELLVHINSVGATVVQLGVPELDMTIDADTTYPTLANTILESLVRQYLLLKARREFDPSASETISKAIYEALIILEGRITHEAEESAPPPS